MKKSLDRHYWIRKKETRCCKSSRSFLEKDSNGIRDTVFSYLPKIAYKGKLCGNLNISKKLLKKDEIKRSDKI